MNWQHLSAFVWLRWRLMVNQWRRAGRLNGVLMVIVAIGALVTAIPLLIGSFVFGTYAIPDASPAMILYAWDGVVLAFLMFWSIGLMTELQRSDPLALSKFMHLPVSVNGAFLLNYLSSLVRLSLIIFGPVMLGFAFALIYVKGWTLLPVLALLAAFLLMVTALTYQFQGWLASLMGDPRRRRTVVVITTGLFILVFQLPNLINLYAPWNSKRGPDRNAAMQRELVTIDQAFQLQTFDRAEHDRRMRAVEKKYKLLGDKENRELFESFEQTIRTLNVAFPPWWLPLGVVSAVERQTLPTVLVFLGMTLIGSVSLRRAYRTTVGIFQGRVSSRKGRTPRSVARRQKPADLLIEARIPGVSEPVAAIALAGFRSLVRAPEAKMALMTPVIMCVIFGSMMFNGRQSLPELLRPLTAIGGISCVLLGVLQLAGNQFGFDRDGFRVFVLCAAPRRDILFGKNLAYAPLALGLGVILIATVQSLCPLRIDLFLAMFPQLMSMFLLCCLFTNLMAIYTPVYMPAGSLKPSSPKVTAVLLQMLMFLVLFPLTQGLTLLPLGAEALLNGLGWTSLAPVCLLLSLVECLVIVVLYLFALKWQGGLLQRREQLILETVTNRG